MAEFREERLRPAPQLNVFDKLRGGQVSYADPIERVPPYGGVDLAFANLKQVSLCRNVPCDCGFRQNRRSVCEFLCWT
jgi:hypothetical protein